jgi:hypothetical protein
MPIRERQQLRVRQGSPHSPLKIDQPYDSPYGSDDFHDGKLEFSDSIYNKDDSTCCPTGGTVTGTYQIIEDARETPPIWKIVIATLRRIPPEAR